MDSSRIRRSIKLAKAVKIWFWDTVREYTGQAVELSPDGAVALLKMGGTGMATVIPNKTVMDGLIKHLRGRVVEFRITGQSLEASLKGTITEVQPDFQNPRRLLVTARFQSGSQKSRDILGHLGKNLAPPV